MTNYFQNVDVLQDSKEALKKIKVPDFDYCQFSKDCLKGIAKVCEIVVLR